MSNHFHKIGPKYYLTDWCGVLIQAMDEVSLALFIKEDGSVTLVHYGSGASVNAWYNEHEHDYPAESGDKLMIFTGSGWSIRELNLLLSTDAYAKVFYNRLLGECNDSNDLQ